MVRSYPPQLFISNRTTDYPPQGRESGGVTPPVGNEMLYEDGTIMLYEDSTPMGYEN